MVNLSDCAAMGATPIALTLALTLPQAEEAWLARFARGLQEALQAHQVALIGGDLTRGALSLTGTVQGIAPPSGGQAFRRVAGRSTLCHWSARIGGFCRGGV